MMNSSCFPRLIAGVLSGSGPLQRQTALRPGVSGVRMASWSGLLAYSGREPLRLIHWKLSARGDDLLVKEFGRQSCATACD